MTDSGPRPPRKKKGKQAAKRLARLETIGLLAAFVIGLIILAYLSWPPGAKYLYIHAQTLMASNDATDWIRAREEYLDPLDTRFPKHPYKADTEAWRDRLDLREATRRAEILEKPNLAAFSKPKTEAEALYANSFNEAAAALKLHHDPDAETIWRTMAQQVPHEGRENRGWVLIAQAKADEIAKVITNRRVTVAGLLQKAIIPDALANNAAARKYAHDVLTDLVTRFAAYPDVSDLVAGAQSLLDAEAALDTIKNP